MIYTCYFDYIEEIVINYQKFYMEFNVMVSGRTIKLKSVNCLSMDGSLYSHHYEIEHNTRLL